MFCSRCGKEISDIAEICVHCGNSTKQAKKNAQDSNSVGWWWLGFFFPTIGFILWAIWTGSYPLKAKRAGYGALFGVIASIAAVVLFYVAYFALIVLLGIGMSDLMYY